MIIERCCAFTGHRPKKFPWGYNEADIRCVALKKAITALAVLALKKENPALKLHCVLPCEGQADKWTASARGLYFSILEQADM